MNPGLAITCKMLLAASQINDIDEAVASVQDQVGIEEGDIAGIVLEQYRDAWPIASTIERMTWLESWRDSEIVHGDPAGRSLAEIHAGTPVEPMSQEQYTKNPGVCPACRSTDIEGHSFNVDGNSATQEVGCNACNAEWSDVYHLSGYSDLETP